MKSPAQIRRELAEGHWLLAEHRQAISCLRLALEAEPDDPILHELLERFLTEAEQGVASARNLAALTQLVHPPARAGSSTTPPEPRFAITTPTMAELLEQQGHREQALEVAKGVLSKSPHDARALAVCERLRPPARPASGSKSESKAYKRQLHALEVWLDYFQARSPGDARA